MGSFESFNDANDGSHSKGNTPIKSLPKWGTNISDLGNGPWTEVSLGGMSECGKFALANNGMILPAWGSTINLSDDAPWKGMLSGKVSKCGNFFISLQRRIFMSYEQMNVMRTTEENAKNKNAKQAIPDYGRDESKVCSFLMLMLPDLIIHSCVPKIITFLIVPKHREDKRTQLLISRR